MLDSLSSITQLETSIACCSTGGLGERCSSFFTSPPEKLCGLVEMKVKIPTTIEGFFELFFTNKILDFIYTPTTKKQKEKNERKSIVSHLISKQEIKTFISIYMQLGIKNVSNFSLCWAKSNRFIWNPIISRLMTLERFTEINQMFTMISKKDIINNKFELECKTVLYLEKLFSSVYEPGEYISIDEGMMAFKRKMKNRVYNPMKPDKWGMKFYICAESKTSYVLNLSICGECATLDRTVHDLTVNLTGKNRKLFMDNYYNSFDIAEKLYNFGI
ncbi:PiggyBac transposable element-derived protein 4 [Cucumispora dikerogammari]|nr:PiggyBac transposable element-derived protein 4 [Cucumispora dikerogammari]